MRMAPFPLRTLRVTEASGSVASGMNICGCCVESVPINRLGMMPAIVEGTLLANSLLRPFGTDYVARMTKATAAERRAQRVDSDCSRLRPSAVS